MPPSTVPASRFVFILMKCDSNGIRIASAYHTGVVPFMHYTTLRENSSYACEQETVAQEIIVFFEPADTIGASSLQTRCAMHFDANARRDFQRKIRGDLTERDEILVMFAYRLSVLGHQDQQRDSGEPFAEHPRRVALILTEEVGITDPEMLSAALLHDLIEDANPHGMWVLTWRSMRVVFGKRVHDLVRVLTKKPGERREHYFGRVACADDDASVIKLADRLDNLRTLSAWGADHQRRYIEETRSVLLPIAERVNAYLADEIRHTCEDVERGLASAPLPELF